MKQIVTALLLISSFFLQQAAANDKGMITPNVLESFQSTFSNATEVNWMTGKDCVKASFVLNGDHMTAFYGVNGQFIAVTKNITTNELPSGLNNSLKKRMEDFWITELFEVTNEEGKVYFITLENADQVVILQSNGDKSWSVYQKKTKN